jgi:DNA polymerase-1
MTLSVGALLAGRGLVAMVPVAANDDLRAPLDAIVVCDGGDVVTVPLQERTGDDDEGVRALAAWLRRSDRTVLFEEARPALRRLLRSGVDVARPICADTLDRLLGSNVDDGRAVARNVAVASERARALFAGFTDKLARVEASGQRRVARLECLVLRPFASLEDRGLPIDAPGWRALVDGERVLQRAAREDVLAACGDVVQRDLFGTPHVNVDSDVEMKGVLERLLGTTLDDISRYTLAHVEHPFASALLRYRESSKIVNAYGDAFLSRIDRRTGRIHATFVPLGASTGRVASRDPNLQNLPADARFHQCLRAPEGRVLVTADYATCELRIVAELSGDRVFLEAFARGEDLHATVASQMFGLPVSKTENPHLRQKAKAINFGLVYGMGAGALASQLKVDRPTADELLAKYFQTFPDVKQYLEDSVERALQKGYAETVLGRRLQFDRAVLESPQARGELSRIAKNMPIQGTSADMTKLAMVRVHERLVDDHPGAGLVNTIHDELVAECDAKDAEAVCAAVREEMGAAHETLLPRVPPLVEVHAGPCWLH